MEYYILGSILLGTYHPPEDIDKKSKQTIQSINLCLNRFFHSIITPVAQNLGLR